MLPKGTGSRHSCLVALSERAGFSRTAFAAGLIASIRLPVSMAYVAVTRNHTLLVIDRNTIGSNSRFVTKKHLHAAFRSVCDMPNVRLLANESGHIL
jgi:hypothetical protein